MTNSLLLLLAIAVFSAFTIWVARKYGVQRSISASIHVLTGAWEKSTYSWFIIGVAIPMMLVSNTVLGWWAGALLAIDAAAPSTNNDKLQMFLHCFGADAGMILGLVMLITFGLWWLVGLAVLACGAILIWGKNTTWWIETTVFFTVMIGLFIEKVI